MTTSAKTGRVIAAATGAACLLALAACGEATAPATAPDRLSADTTINEAPAPVPVQAPSTSAAPNKAPNQPVGWCKAVDLKVSTSEGPAPVNTDRLFTITLASAGGAPCTIRGTISDVRFLSSSGAELEVPIGGGQPPEPPAAVTVDTAHSAVVYLKTAKDAQTQPVTSISFTLPGDGQRGEPVITDWPAPTGGPIHIGLITAPVS